jgi:hypothetical protein
MFRHFFYDATCVVKIGTTFKKRLVELPQRGAGDITTLRKGSRCRDEVLAISNITAEIGMNGEVLAISNKTAEVGMNGDVLAISNKKAEVGMSAGVREMRTQMKKRWWVKSGRVSR